MSTLKTLERPMNHVRLACLGPECGVFHDVHVPLDDPTLLLRELQSWDYKHSKPTCRKTFPVFLKREIPRDFDDSEFERAGKAPWWLDPALHGLKENTNFQASFVASAALTLTSWATLASDTNLLAGASTAVVDNGATGAPLEIGITAQVKNGTTPTTAKEIDIYAWCKQDDSTYPDAISGSDAAITISSATALSEALALAVSFASTTTTGSTYPTGWHTMRMLALSPLFGGILPRYWGLWIVHNSVAAFASGSTAAQKGIYIAG